MDLTPKYKAGDRLYLSKETEGEGAGREVEIIETCPELRAGEQIWYLLRAGSHKFYAFETELCTILHASMAD